MATKKLKLKIVTPERLVFEQDVDQVTLPTKEGEITVLPDHVPLVASLASGDLVAKENGEVIPFALSGGFVEINNNEVAVLADFAEHVADITDDAIEKAKARSEELKAKMNDKDHVDFEHFESELERSLTRVKIADKWRKKKYK